MIQRILLIAYEYPPLGGGTGKAVKNTALALARRDLEPTVLTSAFGDLPNREEDRGVTVVRIPVRRRHLNLAGSLEVLSFGASGLRRADRVFRDFKPDLCLAYHTIPSGPIARRILRRSGVPYMTLLRGQDVPGYPETARWMHRLAWPVTRRVWRSSLRVIANSRGLADLAHESDPNLKIDVVNNGIDLDLYRPASEEPGESDRPVRVLYVGRLIRKKRIRELVEALAILGPGATAPLELRIAGFGPESEPLENLASRLGLSGRVRLLGRLDEAAVVEALRSSDVFVNLSEGEGLPNAVMEAMACGLPTLLSDIPPHRELVGDEVGGLLCDGGDPAAIARSLAGLADSAERRKRIGSAARRTMEENFSWDSVTRRLVELFPSE